jgi:hypothetical protein
MRRHEPTHIACPITARVRNTVGPRTVVAVTAVLFCGCGGSVDPSSAEVEKVVAKQFGGHFSCNTNAPPHEYRCGSEDGLVAVTFKAQDGRIFQVGKAQVSGPFAP